jgi:hypothetical protein
VLYSGPAGDGSAASHRSRNRAVLPLAENWARLFLIFRSASGVPHALADSAAMGVQQKAPTPRELGLYIGLFGYGFF